MDERIESPCLLEIKWSSLLQGAGFLPVQAALWDTDRLEDHRTSIIITETSTALANLDYPRSIVVVHDEFESDLFTLISVFLEFRFCKLRSPLNLTILEKSA